MPQPTLPEETVKTLSAAVTKGEIAAPWWEGVSVARVVTSDGRPMLQFTEDAYQRLFSRLTELEDGEVDAETVRIALDLLVWCRLSGAVAPRLQWHGGDAVVLFWTSAMVNVFFTVTTDGFSFLREVDGEIEARKDDIPFDEWRRIFPRPSTTH